MTEPSAEHSSPMRTCGNNRGSSSVNLGVRAGPSGCCSCGRLVQAGRLGSLQQAPARPHRVGGGGVVRPLPAVVVDGLQNHANHIIPAHSQAGTGEERTRQHLLKPLHACLAHSQARRCTGHDGTLHIHLAVSWPSDSLATSPIVAWLLPHFALSSAAVWPGAAQPPHLWIQLHHCRPLPSGPPANMEKTGIMRPSAPPSLASTMPVRSTTTRVCAAAAASSHALHTSAR
jgi:hypothetical protein